MRAVKGLLLVVGLGASSVAILGLFNKTIQHKGKTMTDIQGAQTTRRELSLTSAAFNNNEPVPDKYTCKGENLNPPLTIKSRVKDVKSYALVVDDPDAVSGTWTHWLVWNIPPDTTEISENSVPANSTEGTTDFGEPGYGGPCPPAGTGKHHYRFKLYALDQVLGLESNANKHQLEQTMQNHILASTELVGTFSAE